MKKKIDWETIFLSAITSIIMGYLIKMILTKILPDRFDGKNIIRAAL